MAVREIARAARSQGHSDIDNDTVQNDPCDGDGDDGVRAEPEASSEASDEVSAASMVDTRGVDWALVRPDYVEGDWSLERIGAKHGTSESTIRKRAKRHGWVRLVGTKPLAAGRRSRRPGAALPTPQETRRKRMLQRLFQVLDAKMSELEVRMTQGMNEGIGNTQSAADAERDARSLNALARLYAKLVELDDAASGGAPETPAKDGDDADRLRRDLADRLARLSGAGDA